VILTADWIGTALGVAAFTGLYLSAAGHGSAHALELTTTALAGALLLTSLCARGAVGAAGRRGAEDGPGVPEATCSSICNAR
jgi:hypothetical protein